MKKRIVLLGVLILIVLGISFWKRDADSFKETEMDLVASFESEITTNSLWCGTLNLLWNEMKDTFGRDLVFKTTPKMVEDLNKDVFTKENLSEKDYYIKSGHPTLALKKEIETEIEKKFQEKSDILDSFSWDGRGEKDYFLYTMLKKNFEFLNEFESLGKSKFKDTEDVSYFGISENQNLFHQVVVLYYKDDTEFAVKLLTKGNDEVLLARGITGTSFKEIYQKLEEKSNKEVEYMKGTDRLKIPFLNFKVKREFAELEGIPFWTKRQEEYTLEKVVQTIEFELNAKGGKVKSEAGMMFNMSSMNAPRLFHFDDTFVLFLKEENRRYPYLGMYVSDITKVISFE